MQLFIKLFLYCQIIITVIILTILVTQFNPPDISGTAQVSKQDHNSAHLVKSVLTLKCTIYDSDEYGVIYSIAEMERETDYTHSAQEEQSSDPRDSTVITMQRHGTPDGISPVYSLTVHGNGSVIYNGIRNVDISGIETYQIPKDKGRELVNEFINIYYFALKDKYIDSTNASSLDRVTTSININGRIKTVLDDKSSYAPASLRALEDKIDQATDSKRLIRLQ